VTGTSETFALGNPDYVTIKYNNSGQQQWIARYDGGANSNDRASAIAVDGSRNIYVTGTSGVSTDYATLSTTVPDSNNGWRATPPRESGGDRTRQLGQRLCHRT
jgi:hypothetical protein